MPVNQTDVLNILPEEKMETALEIVEALKEMPSMKAIVLGGSYARGSARAGSDVDIGIYYSDSEPLDIPTIKRIAVNFSTPHQVPTVTELYEWGRWVNGGAWIQSRSCKIDLLYRSLEHVERVIEEANWKNLLGF